MEIPVETFEIVEKRYFHSNHRGFALKPRVCFVKFFQLSRVYCAYTLFFKYLIIRITFRSVQRYNDDSVSER